MDLLTTDDLVVLAGDVVTKEGLTQQAVADRLGIKHRTLINHALNGKSLKTCMRILEEIGGYRVGYAVTMED